MSDADNAAVVVRTGDCPCPGTPHAEERVTLAPALTLPVASGAMAAWAAADAVLSAQQAAIIAAYLPATITAWTFTDEKSQPVPITREAMERLLPWDKGGMEVAELADSQYSARLLAPLVERIRRLLPPTPTDDSTSANPSSGETPPEPSGSSSPDDSAGRPSGDPVP